MKNIIKILFTLIFILTVSAHLVADEKNLIKEWEAINDKVVSAYNEGRYQDGAKLAEKAYEYAKSNLGVKHPSTLTSLNSLGLLYKSQGRYSEVENLYKKALLSRQEVLGDKHPSTIISLSNLGGLYESQGRYTEAETLYEKALQLSKEALGAKHPSTITSLNNLGFLYESQGRYTKAEPLYKEALRLSDEVLGTKHPTTITSLNNLGLLYSSLGRYKEAAPLYKKALLLRQKVLGAKHPDTITSLNNLGVLYESQGKYSEAVQLFKEALRLNKKILGAKHPSTITNQNNLGILYELQGRYSKAEPLHKEALRLRKEVLGVKHPDTLRSLDNLGVLYESQGRYSKAEPLHKEALRLRKEVLGAKHPDTLRSLDNLGVLYESQGRYSEAEPLYKEALRLRHEILGVKHPDTLRSLDNLGVLYESQGRYIEAEPLYKEAFRLRQDVLGLKHPDTLHSLNNLGVLYESQGRYSEAEPLFKQAFRLRQEVLGLKHPDTVTSLNNLGVLYESQGKYRKAEPFYKEAVRFREDLLGKEHPDTIDAMLHHAVCLINLKKFRIAFLSLETMEQRLLARSGHLLHSTQKERVKRLFFETKTSFQDVVFTLAGLYNSKDVSRFAANVTLRWKHIQGDEQAFIAKLTQTSNDPQIKKLTAKIASLRALLPRIFQADSNKHGARSSEEVLKELELAELELAGLSQEYKENLEVYGANVHSVRAGLPTSAALIEFRLYKEFDFKKSEYGGLHVAASLILADNDELYFEDLGPVEPKLKSFISENWFKDIYRFLMGRFDDKIKNIKTLYIAPDGFLNLVPFNQLITPDGSFLVERQETRIVQTGRDILRSKRKSGSNKLVALGGIVYDKFSDKFASKNQKVSNEASVNNASLKKELDGFVYLPASREEVNKIALYYKRSRNAPAEVLVGVDASEAALKGLKQSPRILHLSTHGYYLKSDELEIERPMLLSGLPLAGANHGRKGIAGPDGEDGILYAIEIMGLNLNGTELVSLSASATGRGVLDYTEGVYGLVRAFRIAGAQSVLMTLTPVGDRNARDFMVAFYKNWFQQKEGAHPATALRKTKLDFINHKNKRYRNPEFWSPYVLVGK